jgi:hypothetical protein
MPGHYLFSPQGQTEWLLGIGGPTTRSSSVGLPENGEDGRVGEARRITFAVINVTDNVRGELSAHMITVSN